MFHPLEGASAPIQNTKLTFQKPSLRLTERDLGILQFVLEMKFATLADIHQKFFRLTKAGTISHSLIWARQRVSDLNNAGFLRACYEVCPTPILVITQRGYLFLRNSQLQKSLPRPMLEVDNRFFDHDHRVTQVRLALEATGVIENWISERQLLEVDEYKDHFSSEFRPDGIYVKASGEKVAFELEIARKSKERYKTKIKRYIDLMIHPKHSELFTQVHYVCEKPAVIKLLSSHTELFQNLFTFDLIAKFQTEKSRP